MSHHIFFYLLWFQCILIIFRTTYRILLCRALRTFFSVFGFLFYTPFCISTWKSVFFLKKISIFYCLSFELYLLRLSISNAIFFSPFLYLSPSFLSSHYFALCKFWSYLFLKTLRLNCFHCVRSNHISHNNKKRKKRRRGRRRKNYSFSFANSFD